MKYMRADHTNASTSIPRATERHLIRRDAPSSQKGSLITPR